MIMGLITLGFVLSLVSGLLTYGLAKEWRRHLYLENSLIKHTAFIECLLWLAGLLWPVMLWAAIGNLKKDKYRFRLCFKMPKELRR